MNIFKKHLFGLLKKLLYPFTELFRIILEQLHLLQLGRKIPGRRGLPLLGNVLEIGRDSEAATDYILEDHIRFGSVFGSFVGPFLVAGTANIEDHEDFLAGYEYSKKGFLYGFLKPWLGDGLLVSTGDKWHRRRKILTPAFHFKILGQFVPTFNSCGDEFVKQMKYVMGEAPIDIFPYVKRLTLDVICETTMGVKVNAQTSSESDYVNAVNEMGDILNKHVLRPWLYPNFIFRLSSLGRRFKASLKILHGMTRKVIRERRAELEKLNAWKTISDISDLGLRHRVAFLDLLLLAARDGSLSDTDIQEEVDTFMFEGHDTTASAITITLYLLSLNQHFQEKIFEELEGVFDITKPLNPSLQDLSELKYTEMVIKESLRMCPPVAGVSRTITSDYKLPSRDLTIPKGSELFCMLFLLHRNPEVFPEPATFDPERFSADECARRHPFAFLPFSAGPRNCIGKRFAMLEMKSIIAKIIWNFHIHPDPEYIPNIVWEMVLRPKNGCFMILEKRN